MRLLLRVKSRETGEERSVVRCKGVSLGAAAEGMLTEPAIAHLVPSHSPPFHPHLSPFQVTVRGSELRVPQFQIARGPNDGYRVYSREFMKLIRFTSSKRAFYANDPNLGTYPYGTR